MEEVLNFSATKILQMIKSGQVSPVSLVELCVRKAKENLHNEYITVMEESAMKRAIESLERVNNGNCRELEGLPIAVKDVYCTEGELTTAGSKILSNFRPPYTASIVKFLEDEGAIVIGKLNLDEFAMGSSGENSAYGPSKNPLDKNRVCGGSSSGSAAAVAGGSVYISLGTDTGGSVRLPASFCGLVGFKPSYGAFSRHGMIPLASSLDHPAIFSRNVADVRLIAPIMGRECDRDSKYRKISFNKNFLPKIKFGYIIEQLHKVSEPVKLMFAQAIKKLQKKGFEIEAFSVPNVQDALKIYYTILPAEAYSNLAKYDCMRFGHKVTSISSKEQYTAARSLFGPEVKRRIILGADILYNRKEDLVAAKRYRENFIAKFNRFLEKVTVILSPTTANIAFKLNSKRNPEEEYAEDILTVLANVLKLPAISIKSGESEGMPLGLTIMGKEDSQTIDVAELLESLLSEEGK